MSVNLREKAFSGKAISELLIDVFDKGMPFRFKAKGLSMWPFIKDGDILTLHRVSVRQVKIGDVVATYNESAGSLIVHRLIKRNLQFFILKGDNNRWADEPIPKTNILGKVEKIERKGRIICLGLGKEKLLIAWLVRMNVTLTVLSKIKTITARRLI